MEFFGQEGRWCGRQMTEQFELSYQALIDQIIRGIEFNYPDVHREDIEGKLWEYVYASGSEVPAFSSGVSGVLRRIASNLARKVRGRNLSSSCQYSYLVSDVYRMADSLFEEAPYWAPEDSRTLERDGMAAVECRMDMLRALERLDWEHRGAIIRRYRLGVVSERGTAEYRKLSRAIKALTMEMNSFGN